MGTLRVLSAVLVVGCGPTDTLVDAGDVDGFTDAAPGCVNLQCRQVTCTGGGTTSLSGVVYAPNGTLPIYNAIVYVPNGEVAAFDAEIACDRCGNTLSGSPLVQTTTDTMGAFRLDNVPVGQSIPLVIQVGRWRRQVTIDYVPECVDTAVAAADTHLPKRQDQGDLPRIALTTGEADALECLLRKIGIDDGEFGTAGSTKRVHLYNGFDGTDRFDATLGGGLFSPAPAFWNSLDNLMKYDVVIHSCEGRSDGDQDNKSVDARAALKRYADAGGRVFMSHWHHYWLELGPDPWPELVTYRHDGDAGDLTATIEQGLAKTRDLSTWLAYVQPGSTLGQVALQDAKEEVASVDMQRVERWIYHPAVNPDSVQYMAMNTPVEDPPEEQCGRMVLSDIHVSVDSDSNGGIEFPDACSNAALTAQEKVLAFMIFDISSCIAEPVD